MTDFFFVKIKEEKREGGGGSIEKYKKEEKRVSPSTNSFQETKNLVCFSVSKTELN